MMLMMQTVIRHYIWFLTYKSLVYFSLGQTVQLIKSVTVSHRQLVQVLTPAPLRYYIRQLAIYLYDLSALVNCYIIRSHISFAHPSTFSSINISPPNTLSAVSNAILSTWSQVNWFSSWLFRSSIYLIIVTIYFYYLNIFIYSSSLIIYTEYIFLLMSDKTYQLKDPLIVFGRQPN